jgi:hypothetical protein
MLVVIQMAWYAATILGEITGKTEFAGGVSVALLTILWIFPTNDKGIYMQCLLMLHP